MNFLTFTSILLLSFSALAFPPDWFKEIPRSEAQSWEILPQDAKEGEVILSKRTELGIFSNFGDTPFVLDETLFASIEGLWQSLKFPDPLQPQDSRHKISNWPLTRRQVEGLTGMEAKKAGNEANKIYRDHQLVDVSYGDHFFNYTDHKEGSEFHYRLIKRAIREKLNQNSGLWQLLLKTECLRLRPDHDVKEDAPPAYHYYKILMELRSEKLQINCP